ncbi:MAG: transcriptional regulator NrdR [Rhodospirillaceae bacterium]|nr:transcriptional regulator NrdR [Rhodospirillaceae bacterium]
MRCPFCGNEDTQVKDSRPTDDNSAIRRRRQCLNCGARFTTFERIQLRELTVVKGNGRREPFERDKLMRSIQIALRKRPVEPDRVDRVVNGIVRRLESLGESEIPSKLVGEMVMDALSTLDQVAFVRFASVYRNFREAKDFEEFVGQLGGDPE